MKRKKERKKRTAPSWAKKKKPVNFLWKRKRKDGQKKEVFFRPTNIGGKGGPPGILWREGGEKRRKKPASIATKNTKDHFS